MTQRSERIEAIRAAFLIGVQKHFPKVERVEISDDALIDMFEMNFLDMPESEFQKLLTELQNPEPPEPLERTVET